MRIVQKNILLAIGIPTDQIAGFRGKGHITAVFRNNRIARTAIRLCSVRGDRYAAGDARCQIVSKNVISWPVGVVINQIIGAGSKNDVTAVP